MSLDVDDRPEGQPGEPRAFGRRLIDAYRYGNFVVITVLAFVAAFVVGGLLIAFSDVPTRTSMGYFFSAPGDTFSNGWSAVSGGYSALFRGAIFNPDSLYSNGGVPVLGPISETLLNAAPLILGGLSVGIAFRAGLFNIGVQGQLFIGAICAAWVGFTFQLPPVIHVLAALAAGMIGGALWGGLAGWLKARTGAHEVISTIMLNYVAFNLLNYLLGVSWFQNEASNQAISRPIHATARLPHLLGSNLRLHAGLLIAILAAVFCWWLLTRSTLGFSLRAVGANALAARTAGMSVGRSYVTVMLIAGSLSGLVGCCQVLGTNPGGMANDIDAGYGFDAITVALLGQATPGGTVLAGLLFGALRAGAVQMSVDTGTPPDVIQVMQAVIVLFIAAPALVRAIFRLREARGGRGGVGELAKGWNG